MEDGLVIEDLIEEELSRVNLADAESASSSEVGDSKDDEAENADDCNDLDLHTMPESFLSYLELERKRMRAFENAILDECDENDVTNSGMYCRDILKDVFSNYQEDPLYLKKIISEVDDEASRASVDKIKPVPVEDSSACCRNEDIQGSDVYVQIEKTFSLELENLEKRFKEEDEQRIRKEQKVQERFLKEQAEEEDTRRCRYRDFQDELRRIQEENTIQDLKTNEVNTPQLEILKQEQLIAELEKQMEKERQAIEEAQAREQRRILGLRCRAATKIQACIRSFLVYKRTAAILKEKRKERRMRKEQQLRLQRERKERRRQEEENRMIIEEEERRIREKEEKRIKEEERMISMEEVKRIREEEERRIREEEEDWRIREEEEERRIREEEEKRARDEEKKRIREEERRIKEEEEKRRITEEERMIREKKERRIREEERRNGEEGSITKKEDIKIREEKANSREQMEKSELREKDRINDYSTEHLKGVREQMEEKKPVEVALGDGLEPQKLRVEERKGRVSEEVQSHGEECDMMFGSRGGKAIKRMSVEQEQGTEVLQQSEGQTREEKWLPFPSVDKHEEEKPPLYCERKCFTPTDKVRTQKQFELLEFEDKGAFECHTDISVQCSKTLSDVITQDNLVLPVKSHLATGALSVIDGRHQSLFDTQGWCMEGKHNLAEGDSVEQMRLEWIRTCTPWAKLASLNKKKCPRKRKVVVRGPAPGLPPVGVENILHGSTWTSLKQVTTVTLEDLPGCSLSTLSECTKLQVLVLRRCGLTAFEGISACKDLRCVDVQENSIRFVNCQDLENLRVLILSQNQLTSIHGLESAINLEVLELSYNQISRISGLESLKRLQTLLIDHNQLISTRGLGHTYTLLYLDCSYNHLTSVNSIGDCALLMALRLQGNNLAEPPCLSNHALLRELHLDDNSIVSLGSLSLSWLPLLQHISVSQNSVTQLPSLSHFVSLLTLDVSHNCLTDLSNVWLGLHGCHHLQNLSVVGNPFQQEANWRSALLEAVPGLEQINGEWLRGFLDPHTPQEGTAPPGSFLALCQAQIRQLEQLERTQKTELCTAPSPSAALLTRCNHGHQLLHLAVEQRYAHEYGVLSFSDGADSESQGSLWAQEVAHELHKGDPGGGHVGGSGQGTEHLMWGAEHRCQRAEHPSWGAEHPSRGAEYPCGAEYPTQGQAIMLRSRKEQAESWEAGHLDQQFAFPLAKENSKTDRHVTDSELHAIDLGDPQRYREGRARAADPAEQSIGLDHKLQLKQCSQGRAATTIQAVWRGHALRRKLAKALALAHVSDGEEDFDDVDVDEFSFDEAALEDNWTGLDSKAGPYVTSVRSDQLLWPKPPGAQTATAGGGVSTLLWESRQALPSVETDARMEVMTLLCPSPPHESSTGVNSEMMPVVTPDAQAENILEEWGLTDRYTAHLMLKRAQKMKAKKQPRKLLDPAMRLALFRSNENKRGPGKAPTHTGAEKTDHYKGPHAADADENGASSGRDWRWLHAQHLPSRETRTFTESDHFLPEIDPDVLNGKRVQLVAGSGSRAGPDEDAESWARRAALSPAHKEHNQARRRSVGHTSKEHPSPARLSSAPNRRERISFRDNPLQLSGGWGRGRARTKLSR